MSRYQYLTQWDSPAHTKGRQGKTPEGIVIHHWGAEGQTRDASHDNYA